MNGKQLHLDYDEYIVFILGFDNFELSQYIRMNPKHYGADEIYDFCVMIAKDFEKSEENKNLAIGQYTALERFLDKNTLKYMEIYNEEKRNDKI